MSGFRFPLQQDPTPPSLAVPATPLQELSNTFPNDDKENASDVSFKPKLSMASNPQDPVTPEMFKKPLRVVQAPPPQAAVDDLPTFYDLITWKNPPASFLALVGGECGMCLIQWCVGFGHTTFTSGLCNALLLLLAAHFAFGCFSERLLLGCRWRGSPAERILLDRTQDGLAYLMMQHDEFFCNLNPWTMFRTAAALTLGNLVGAYVGFWKLAMLGWACLFTVPITREHLGSKIHRVYQLALKKIQEPIKRLKLSRLAKFAICSAVILVVMLLSSWTVRASMLLLFLMLVRCSLKNTEIKYLREHQYTKAVQNSIIMRSARKATCHMRNFADDVIASAMKSARWQVDADRPRTRNE